MKENWISEAPLESTNGTFAFIIDHLDVPKLEPYTLRVMAPFIVASVHILLALISIWSVRFRVFLKYQQATEADATDVLFVPQEHRGSADIVPLNRETDPMSAVFQQKKREWKSGQFVPLKYPVDLEIHEYLESRGLNQSEIKKRLNYFGPNAYEVPGPTFMELLKEHVLAPFFVFQVFSICCWMLDEYFIYPLISLVSLLLIEGNTVRTRQSNLLELRGVRNEPIRLNVYRDEQWISVEGSKLVPGDLVLVTSEILCPADFLLVSGRAIVNEAMLTGESTPQVKESVETLQPNHVLNVQLDKRHIIFGGTRIEQLMPANTAMYVPQNGCLAYVLSTGLGSSQGKLIRTMIFASQRVAAESRDAMQLLLFLTIFAIAASAYVVSKCWHNESISTYRIIVRVIMIITATIPPDLPMTLTFAVNASLLALSKLSVFCTEPFRIPIAGTVSVCCFDKTGTITAEEYKLIGIDEMKDGVEEVTIDGVTGKLTSEPELLGDSLMVVGGCHSLVKGGDKGLVGDSLEAAGFTALGFTQTPAGKNKHKKYVLSTVKTFHFSAELRRMSTIATVVGQSKTFVLTKGAPEAVAQFLSVVPPHYTETFRNYTRQGCRVLALACKQVNGSDAERMTREEAERDLTFCGFSVFAAPFKRGSEDTIVELLRSTHRVIIITGDDPLTACHVAQRTHIITKPPLIHDGNGVLDSYGNPAKDNESYSLCYTGKAIEQLNDSEFREVVKKCNIYARMSPQSKALVLTKLKELGEKTLMCGDGTNDVGALKQAHVGVGLVENSIQTEIDQDEYTPKLGAASIAAPFVSKRATISGCLDLIRFGRATLSSTIDLFKQLSLNSLVNAFTMSVLFVENVTFGDQQMSIFAVCVSFAFLAISWAKPRRELSQERPPESQFNAYLVISVLLQFIVHYCLFTMVRRLVFAEGYVTKEFNYKLKFEPGLMNTAMFIMNTATQVTTFVVNYRGYPFMQNFTENKVLLLSVIVCAAIVALLLLHNDGVVRQAFELVEFPSQKFRDTLGIACIADIVICYVLEKICLAVFSFKNKLHARELVSQDILDSIKSYKRHNDDVLPEESHKFGLLDMLKQNIELQKNMVIRRHEIEMEERMNQAKKVKKRKIVRNK